MTPPLEGLLAGLRLALGAGDPQADAATLSRVGDWDAVAGLAAYHRVSPLLLEGLGPEAERTAGSRAALRLRRRRDRMRIRGLRQREALNDAAGALAERGISCIVLKGLPLSQRLHGHFLAREAIDMDLLVSPGAFSSAERTLRDRGWHRRRPDFRETPARNRWHAALSKDVLLERPARAGEGPPLALELHRRLLNNPYLLDVPFERLEAGAVTTVVGGRAFRTLCDDDQLPYLACHGLEHCWHRLKWLCDVAALVASMDEPGLERSLDRCGAQGLDVALAPALALCAKALHVAPARAAASLPFRGRRSVLVERLARRTWSAPDAWGGVAWTLEAKAVKLSMKASLRYVGHEVVTSLVAPHDFGKPDLPDRLLFLHPALRPVVWLLKNARRARDRRRRQGRGTLRSRSSPAGASAPGGRADGRTGER